MVFGRYISTITVAKIVDGTEDVAEVDLAGPWLVPAGNVRKVDLPNEVDVVAKSFDHVSLRNLHVVDVEQDQHPWTSHAADQFQSIVAAIQKVARVIDRRVQELDYDGLSL